MKWDSAVFIKPVSMTSLVKYINKVLHFLFRQYPQYSVHAWRLESKRRKKRLYIA